MSTKLSYPQRMQYYTYLDCKKRTKRKVDFPSEEGRLSDDERLVRFMLENSSVVEQESERSFHRVCNAIDVMCKQLCPGQWCTRLHCKNHSSCSAYNCDKTRPKVCEEYKKYVTKLEAKKK